MSVFGKILGGSADKIGAGIKNVLGGVEGILDEVITNKEELAEVKMKIKEKELEYEKLATDQYLKELDTRVDIIKSEMSQGDVFTKRARPSVVYSGLLFVAIIHVILPIVSFAMKEPLPDITLPSEFWWAWGTVVGVYGVGRTYEKMKVRK